MQLTSSDFGKTYNFETYLKLRYNNLFFVELLSATTLKALGEDPEAMHAQNIGSLPPGTGGYNSYHYGRFTQGDGTSIYIGLPWINPTTLIEADTSTRTVIIRDASEDQMNALRSAMIQLRFTNFEIV